MAQCKSCGASKSKTNTITNVTECAYCGNDQAQGIIVFEEPSISEAEMLDIKLKFRQAYMAYPKPTPILVQYKYN